MKPRIMLHLLSVLLLLCGVITANAQEADAKLEPFFKAYLDQYLRGRPLEATRLGDHRFDSKLENLTPEARAKWLKFTRETLAQLPQIFDYSKLSRAGQIDFETFQHNLKFDEWL